MIKDYSKFFPAIPCYEIIRSQSFLEQTGYFFKREISDFMPVGVIYFFEMVYVTDHQGIWDLIALEACQCLK